MIGDRFADYLLNLRPEEEDELFLIPEPTVAETTSKLDSKVYRTLMTFCTRFNIDEWNMDKSQASAVINALYGLGWARQTIEKSFIPAYKRLFLKHARHDLPDEIGKQMKRVCKTRKYEKGRIPSNPFTLMDCERIMKLSLQCSEVNSRMISLVLIAMYGGVRLNSASSLALGDIVNFTQLQENQFILNIKLRQTKGGKDHFLSFRGRFRSCPRELEVHPMDPVYWFAKYLLEAYGLDLRAVRSWNLSPQESSYKVWGWRADAMRNNFQKWTTSFGYPRLFFNFHSLRRGSLCNRITHGAGDVGSGIMLQSIISSWDPRSRARDRYMGESLKKLVVANDFGQEPIARELLCPELFHGLRFEGSHVADTSTRQDEGHGTNWVSNVRNLRDEMSHLLSRLQEFREQSGSRN